MILFEPADGQMAVNETYLFTNDGKTAWNDPDERHAEILPARGRQGKPAGARPPRPAACRIGAPVQQDREARRLSRSISPSSPARRASTSPTRCPTRKARTYAGKVVTKDENTYLIVPNGVT